MRTCLFISICSILIFSCGNKTHNFDAKSGNSIFNKKNSAIEYSCTDIERKNFLELINDLNSVGFTVQKLKNWNRSYKNNIKSEGQLSDSTIIVLPENTVLKGIKKLNSKHNREISKVSFNHTIISEIVVKKTKSSKYSGDFKIIQFLFMNEDEAKKSIEKMRLISYYTINTDGLKNPNYWWIHNCAIYFCRTRSAGFSLNAVVEQFEKRHGKVKLMRW